MFAYIDGRLVHKEPTYVIIEAGGIGYHIAISLRTYSAVGTTENCKLFTHFLVREDVHALYGFYTYNEKKLFLQLISVSGVGANTAMVILSSMDDIELREAILRGDAKTIEKIKGIGAKTAQRIILELKDKIAKDGLNPENLSVITSSQNKNREEALTALITLGVAKPVAEKVIDKILKSNPDISLEELIKIALKTN